MNWKLRLAVIVAIISVVLAGFWQWQRQQSRQNNHAAAVGLGGQIYAGINPVAEQLPETNPFAVNANPFVNLETNPLKKVAINPF